MKLAEIFNDICDAKIIGNENSNILEVVQIDEVSNKADSLSWVNLKNKDKLAEVVNGSVICEEESLPEELNPSVNYIVVEAPRRVFQHALKKIYNTEVESWGIHPSAIIHPTASIAKNSRIEANVIVEEGVSVGENTIVGGNTVLKKNTKIGSHCTIGCNNTIGGVGFGYEKDENGEWELIPHVGNVVIEDRVDIGNNTTIDRAVLGSTLLRENSKIDNLVHIAHGVIVGRNSTVIANAMVAGSVTIGENTWVAPSSSVLNKKKIGKDVTIGLGAVVLKDVEDGAVIIGNPGKPLVRK